MLPTTGNSKQAYYLFNLISQRTMFVDMTPVAAVSMARKIHVLIYDPGVCNEINSIIYIYIIYL